MQARSGGKARQRLDRLLFLGPATLLLVLFFLAPVLVNLGIAFTDMDRNLKVTQFTTENVARVLSGDQRLLSVMGTTLVYVFGTLAIFNVTFGLILALTTTSLQRIGGFFRGVWLLPRMSPSVLYILLWLWVISPTDVGLLNQVLMRGLGLPTARPAERGAGRADHRLANGFIGASLGMIIFTAAIRWHPRAPVPRRAGRRRRHAGDRSASSRCRRSAGRSAS